jgi:sugar lactone lactonase YvrE
MSANVDGDSQLAEQAPPWATARINVSGRRRMLSMLDGTRDPRMPSGQLGAAAMRGTRGMTMLVVAAVLVACGGTGADDGPTPRPTGTSTRLGFPTAAASPPATEIQASDPGASGTYELVETWGDPTALVAPADVAVMADGRVAVADARTSAIVVLTPAADLERRIVTGVAGLTVAVDAEGNLYGATSATSDSGTTYSIARWSSAGEQTGAFELMTVGERASSPTLIAVDLAVDSQGYLYVLSGVERGTGMQPEPFSGVVVFDPAGARVAELEAPAGYAPQAIAVGPDDSIYVSTARSPGDDQVVVFGRERYAPSDWTDSVVAMPEPVRLDALAVGQDGTLFGLEIATHDPSGADETAVVAFDQQTGDLTRWPVDAHDRDVQTGTAGIAVAPNGSVYVADPAGHRILQLDGDGTLIAEPGAPTEGQLVLPVTIVAGFDGSLAVVDIAADRIVVLNTEGEPGGSIEPPDPLRGPVFGMRPGLAPDGTAYVPSFSGGGISVITKDGSPAERWNDLEGSVGPIAVAPDGTIYAASYSPSAITAFTSDRRQIGSFVLPDDATVSALAAGPESAIVLASTSGSDPTLVEVTYTLLRVMPDGAGQTLATWMIEHEPTASPEFQPQDTALDAAGNILLADSTTGDVIVLDASSRTIHVFAAAD